MKEGVDVPSTVAAVSNVADHAHWIHSFYAAGRHWVFYRSDIGRQVYRSSVDGLTWTDEEVVIDVWSNDHHELTVWFDGTHVHCAFAGGVAGYGTLYYRRGKPNADGTITWSMDWQTVNTGKNVYPCISVDSDGYPWIGYQYTDGGINTPYVTKSSTKDGSWTTEIGFPYQLSAGIVPPNPVWIVHPNPLTGGKVYVTYLPQSLKVYGRLWDGASFGSEETCETIWVDKTEYWSVADGDDVHLIFEKSGPENAVYHVKRTWGDGWGTETFLAERPQFAEHEVTVSLNTSLHRLYVFIAGEDQNSLKTRCLYEGEWIQESHLWNNEPNPRWMTAFYGKHGNYIGVVWKSGTASPYNLRYGIINLVPASYKTASSSGF